MFARCTRLAGPRLMLCLALAASAPIASAQTPPAPAEQARYTGLHAAAQQGDAARIAALLAAGTDPNSRDGNGLARDLIAGRDVDHVNDAID